MGKLSLIGEKRWLQGTVALACLVPVAAGLSGALGGLHGLGAESVLLDSHFRYLSGLLLAIGLGFLSTLRRIEHQSARFLLLTLIVMMGGTARLLGWLAQGFPGYGMFAALLMELVVTPLLCLWQRHLAARWRAL